MVQVTAAVGQSFLDRMIALVEGAIRQRTPNEIALSLVLSAFTLIFLIVVVPLWPMARNAEQYMMSYLGISEPLSSLGTDVPTLVALLVCLIPTTIGALLAAIGIAGMDRALQANIIAKSGKAVETAGDIDTVLLDKTGTITVGNRQARKFLPLGRYVEAHLARVAALASVADETPEGKSIVARAGDSIAPRPARRRAHRVHSLQRADPRAVSICPTAIASSAADAVIAFVRAQNGNVPDTLQETVVAAAREAPRRWSANAEVVGGSSRRPGSIRERLSGCARWVCAPG